MARWTGLLPWRGPITEQKLLGVFRAVSIALAGVDFLVTGAPMPLPLRAVLVAVLGVEAWAAQQSYVWARRGRPTALGAIVAIEALGVLFLAAMTGGIRSPFIWYALNPALVAAGGLAAAACWITLGGSLGAAVLAYHFLFRSVSLLLIVRQNQSLILLFALITLAVQLYAASARALEARNQELDLQRRELKVLNTCLEAESGRAKGLVREVMGLYQVVETASAGTTPAELMQTFSAYARGLTGAPAAFFLPGGDEALVTSGARLPGLSGLLSGLPSPLTEIASLRTGQGELLVAPVRSAAWEYGSIGVLLTPEVQDPASRRDLAFLAELAAVTLERLRLEAAHDGLVALEEQRRIAAEMHDRVAQRLFSLVYALHGVPRRWPHLPEDLRAHLVMLRDTANETLRELRLAISHLSAESDDDAADLVASVEQYCHRLEELHGVPVQLTVEGDLADMPQALRQAVLRIVAEASGNALRHGRATRLQVALSQHGAIMGLEVRDNGKGFDPAALPLASTGQHLGLRNMEVLAQRIGGELEVASRPGEGTVVRVRAGVAFAGDTLGRTGTGHGG